MPGVFGLTWKDGAIDVAELFGSMGRRLRHHPWYKEDRYFNPAGIALGRITLGFVNTAEQPAANADRSLRAVMDGEVYDYAEQRSALTREGHVFRTDSHAELLLHGYESQGQRFFARLHGTFAAAIWDAENRRLLLVNDRFGMKPLYYARAGDRFLFATEIKALLADPDVARKPDLRGVAQFFSYGQLLGEHTLLDAVRLVPAAGWVSWDTVRQQGTLDRYWRLEQGPAASGAQEIDMLDRIDDAFRRAVERRTAGTRNLGISLSGGLDARTIFGVIDHDRVPLTAITMGMEGSIDQRAACQMAALVHCPQHSHTLDEQFLEEFEEHLHRMVHLTDGHYLSQCIVMPTLPVYRSLGIQVLLRGHAGELMHMTKAYNFSLDGEALALRDEASLEAWLLRRLRTFMSHSADGPLFAPALQQQMEAHAVESLRSCLSESRGIRPLAHRIWHLFITQRLRRETSLSLVKFGSVMEVRLPYLDNDLVDALLAGPPELKLDDRIQTHILRKRRPAFLDVVNANTGTRMGAGRLRRLLARARLRVLAKLGVRGYQPYERLGLWLRRELRPLVEKLLLSEPCLDRGLFNPRTIRAVVDSHLSGRRNHTFLLLALMIFETGQRAFVDQVLPRPQPVQC